MSKPVATFDQLKRKPTTAVVSIAQQAGRTRSKLGTKTAVNFRFSQAQWRALRTFALEENVSLQSLVVVALDQLFAARGMPFSSLKDEAQ